MDTDRKRELRAILTERRREVADEIILKLHDIRTEGAEQHNSKVVRNSMDVANDGILEDIELLLVKTKADTLTKINEALGRLNHDVYGLCFDCGGEIAEKRLRALPFAVRCKDCEEKREFSEQRERELTRRGYVGLLFDRS